MSPPDAPGFVVIQLDAVTVGRARQVKSAAGPTTQVGQYRHKDGAAAPQSRVDPRSKYSSIELTGLDASATNAFTQWAHASSNGSSPARNVALSVLDGSGKSVAEYQLANAILTKFSLNAMDARGDQAATGGAVLAAPSVKLSGNVAR